MAALGLFPRSEPKSALVVVLEIRQMAPMGERLATTMMMSNYHLRASVSVGPPEDERLDILTPGNTKLPPTDGYIS